MIPSLLNETHAMERIEAAMIEARRLRFALEQSRCDEDRQVLRKQLAEIERHIESLRGHLGRKRQAS